MRIILFSDEDISFSDMGYFKNVFVMKNILGCGNNSIVNNLKDYYYYRLLGDKYIEIASKILCNVKKKLNCYFNFIIVNPLVYEEQSFKNLIYCLNCLNLRPTIILYKKSNNVNCVYTVPYKYIERFKYVKMVKGMNIKSFFEYIKKFNNNNFSTILPKYKYGNNLIYIPYSNKLLTKIKKYLDTKFITLNKIYDVSNNGNLKRLIYTPIKGEKIMFIPYGEDAYIWFIKTKSLYRLEIEKFKFFNNIINSSNIFPICLMDIITYDTKKILLFYMIGYTGSYNFGNIIEVTNHIINGGATLHPISKEKYTLFIIDENLHFYIPKLHVKEINEELDEYSLFEYSVFYEQNFNEILYK
jgi:hypothetical protein